jgi:hypothetical protein
MKRRRLAPWFQLSQLRSLGVGLQNQPDAILAASVLPPARGRLVLLDAEDHLTALAMVRIIPPD